MVARHFSGKGAHWGRSYKAWIHHFSCHNVSTQNSWFKLERYAHKIVTKSKTGIIIYPSHTSDSSKSMKDTSMVHLSTMTALGNFFHCERCSVSKCVLSTWYSGDVVMRYPEYTKVIIFWNLISLCKHVCTLYPRSTAPVRGNLDVHYEVHGHSSRWCVATLLGYLSPLQACGAISQQWMQLTYHSP